MIKEIPATTPGFLFIHQSVTVLPLWFTDHLDQLRHLALLAGRQLTDLPQRLHNLRLRLPCRNHQAARHHPHVNLHPGIKPRLFQPVALQVNAGAVGVACRAASGFGVRVMVQLML